LSKAQYVRVPIYRSGTLFAEAMVDVIDASLVEGRRWFLTPRGYVLTGIRHPKTGRRTTLGMHRVVMRLDVGDPEHVDHRNGDKLDNRRSNLRVCSHAQNAQNRQSGRGMSRYRGVVREKRRQKWRAQTMLGGRNYHLGYFDDEREAAAVAATFRAQPMPA
jgi:hypothetical protein